MSPDRELLTHTQALRALARDLVGESDADDLLQETALQALQAPPRRPGPIGGWLAAVLRHLASKHRRATVRRRRHEAAAAKPECLQPSREVEDCDAFRRLSEAVVALPEPYRGTLLARYLREELPAAIAARTGVPVRTVKTRLQRGLGLLRERLDRDGGDWRAAFGAVFALGEMLPLAAGAMAMVTTTKVAVGATVVLAAAMVLLLLPDQIPPDRADSRAPAPLPGSSAAVLAAATAAAAPTDGSQRQEVAVAYAAVPAATLRGRCVDAAGKPLAGVTAELRGTAHASRIDAWLRAHREPPPLRLQATTGADGVFALLFAPPPPFRFEVELRDVEHVPMRAFWPELAPGSTTDVGDVLLPAGARIDGRVTDTDALAVAGTRVTLRRRDPEPYSPSFVPIAYWQADTAADGTFAVPAVAAGDYEVTVEDRSIARGEAFRVGPALQPVTLAITLLAKVDAPGIAGIVTDEAGQPLRGVIVRTDLRLLASSRMTDHDGRFEIRRREGYPESAPRLSAECDGFENWQSRGPVPWSTADLQVVMRRGVGLELRVVDATTGAPVEDYRLRVWSEKGPRSALLPAPRAAGLHAGGIMRLAGLPRGFAWVVVEPAAERLLASAPCLCEIGDAPARVEVVLQQARSRKLQVRLADGAPVVGSIVQLADARGMQLDMSSAVRSTRDMYHFHTSNPKLADGAFRLQEATTDAQGEVQLRGPAMPGLTLVLRGPGHVPQVVPAVDLGSAEPLVVTVARGARLQGRATPVEVVGYLRECVHLPATGPLPDALGFVAPRIELARGPEGHREVLPACNPQEIRALARLQGDGSYVIDGVPPGTWDVVLKEQTGHRLQTVTLRDGEARQLDLDLSDMLPGRVRARVLENSQPAADAQVTFVQKGGAAPHDRTASLRTDSSGIAECRLLPGEWSLQLRRDLDESGRAAMFPADETVTVTPGARMQTVLQVRTGTVEVQVLDARGAPVPGIELVLLDESGRCCGRLEATGADGSSRTAALARTFTLATLPKRLATREAQSAFLAEHRGEDDPLAAVRLRLGEVTVPVGQTVEREVRLPPGWDR